MFLVNRCTETVKQGGTDNVQVIIDQKAGEAYIKCNLKQYQIAKQGAWKLDVHRLNAEDPEASPDYGELMLGDDWQDHLTKFNITNADIDAFVKALGINTSKNE